MLLRVFLFVLGKMKGNKFLGICILKILGVIILVYKVVKNFKIFEIRGLFFLIFFIEFGLFLVYNIKLMNFFFVIRRMC